MRRGVTKEKFGLGVELLAIRYYWKSLLWEGWGEPIGSVGPICHLA